ncbi:MAG: C10 family peptidase, partial [Deltaproteobacteria bacterium]|nr:C10 family peptidase [Deltaproteobacteria bacterium]
MRKELGRRLLQLITSISICIFSIQAIAGEVPINVVSRVAKSYYGAFFHSLVKPKVLAAVKAATQGESAPIPLSDHSGQILAYVWQYANGGYIVTSADDRIEPIIMRSATGVFPTSLPNPISNFIVWDISARLKAFATESDVNQAIAETNAAKWRSLAASDTKRISLLSTTTWGPLITTNWTQGSPYNNKCPYMISNEPTSGRRVVGCGATAVAQLLNKWTYPKHISFNYENDHYLRAGINFDEDAANYGFPDFSTLDSSLESIAYDESDSEKANLCFAVGLKIKSSYGVTSDGKRATSSYPDKIADTLCDEFGFGSATLAYSWDTCIENAISNIKKGWPLLLGIENSPPNVKDRVGHFVILDGYSDDGFFHLNFGWGSSNPEDPWYNLPDVNTSYNFDAIFSVIYDINTFYGWPQYGYDQYNRFHTVYGVPTSSPHEKYTRTTRERMKGFIIGEGNWIFATHNPEIISDIYHPHITVVDQYGTLVQDVEVTETTSTISPPVQAPNGDIFFGAGDSVYRFRPRSGKVGRLCKDVGNNFYGDHTPRIDSDGNMYFGSDTKLVSVSQSGDFRWEWDVPSSGVIYTATPSIDSEKENVYIGYWQDSTDEAILVCLNRSTGTVRYNKAFPDIISADRGIHTPAIGTDGTVYLSVRTKIYALTPGTSSFSEKWVVDKLYAKYQPIALGDDNYVYTEYWTQSGGEYYLTLAKLDPANGNVVWEKRKPDVGSYSGFRQPIYAGNGVILFPVYWDSSPDDTWQLYAYSTGGDYLWEYSLSPSSVFDMAVASGNALCIAKNDGNIVALTDGNLGDARSGGMGYANNSPPTVPSNMSPADMSVLSNTSITLLWSDSDPDGHDLKYDIFFGRVTEDESGGLLIPIVRNTTSESFPLVDLTPGATYNWSVQATDGQALSSSPIYSFTIEGVTPDTTPDQFTFDTQPDVALSTVITSNSITVTGINTATPISITGGTY